MSRLAAGLGLGGVFKGRNPHANAIVQFPISVGIAGGWRFNGSVDLGIEPDSDWHLSDWTPCAEGEGCVQYAEWVADTEGRHFLGGEIGFTYDVYLKPNDYAVEVGLSVLAGRFGRSFKDLSHNYYHGTVAQAGFRFMPEFGGTIILRLSLGHLSEFNEDRYGLSHEFYSLVTAGFMFNLI